MLPILKAELEKHGAFLPPDHVFVDAMVRAIPFNTVPHKMKIVFALSHLSQYASQFRRSVELWDGTKVPTNNISFVIADSGANKDSSNNKVKKCFKAGYDRIEEVVKEHLEKEAIEAAERDGADNPCEFAIYKEYLKPAPPAFMSITTGPGLVQHINDIGALPIGSGMQYSGEISDELAHNPNALDNIKILAEVYDLGEKEVTYTKGQEFRSKEIKGQPVSALFVGSPGHILYDETTKKKFHIAFMSKLARRSWFCYTPERMFEPDFSLDDDPIKAMQAHEYQIEQEARSAVEAIKAHVMDLTEYNLKRVGTAVPVSPEVFELFNIYKRYNREVVDHSNNQESVYALVRAHLQWKAIKLAGALALIECSEEISAKHYITAIQYCELFDLDVSRFEYDINKAPHERLSDYLRSTLTVGDKAFITVHDIKKLGFSHTVSANKLAELTSLCAGYDRRGIYSVCENGSGIQYEPHKIATAIGCSSKQIDNTKLNEAIDNNAPADVIKDIKAKIAWTANEGLNHKEYVFEDLIHLLEGDYAYSPFNFTNGSRGKNSIEGGTKWVVFDVDETTMSYKDAHFILEGVNHFIALTSDKKNEYKYRVLVELDATVELSALAWKYFYTGLAEQLGLQVDVLPQSQIFYSYSGRPILSYLEGTPVSTRDLVMEARSKEQDKTAAIRTSTPAQMDKQLKNPLETFWYAFECDKGRRSVTMFRAVKHAKDLGADLTYVLQLLDDINEYIVSKMESTRFNRLKEQVMRMYNEGE